MHLAHIHQGTCANERSGKGGPAEYPLKLLTTKKNETATSTTVVKGVTLSQLFSGAPKYINVHAPRVKAVESPSISCADLSSDSAATSSGGTGSSGGGGQDGY